MRLVWGNFFAMFLKEETGFFLSFSLRDRVEYLISVCRDGISLLDLQLLISSYTMLIQL